MGVEVYESYCQTNDIRIDQNLSSALAKSGVTGEVSLIGTSISCSSCEALGYTLYLSQEITKLNCGNSLLPLPGLCVLFDKLSKSFLTELNLKGNNIFGSATVHLSRMLTKNRTIRVLILEWNNIGEPLSAFSQFCHALLINVTLEVLDLRNNALNFNCANEFTDVIMRNTTIKDIDLRWNNFGVEGGQNLLKVVNNNKTLNFLKVQGNDIPSDIVSAIEETVRHNAIIQKMHTEYSTRQEILTKQIQAINQQRISDIKTMTEQNTQQLQPALEKLKECTSEKRKLVEELEEKQMKIINMEDRLLSSQNQLEKTIQKLHHAETLIAERDKEIVSIEEQSQTEIASIKSKFSAEEKRLKDELTSLQEMIESEKKAKDIVEVKLRDSQLDVQRLTQEVDCLREKLQYITITQDKLLEEERKLHQENINNLMEEIKTQRTRMTQMIEEARHECDEKIKILENKIKELDSSKAEISAELETKKKELIQNAIASETVEHQVLKIDLLNEHLDRSHEYANNLEQELSSCKNNIDVLIKENNKLKNEITESNIKISHLQGKVSEENLLIDQLRKEKANELHSKELLKQEIVKYQNDLSNVQQQLFELYKKLEDLTVQHKKEIDEINKKIQGMNEMRTKEVERARILQCAINKYLAEG